MNNVVNANTIVLNHILNKLYDESSMPNSRFIAISMQQMTSVIDFIDYIIYVWGNGGGKLDDKCLKSVHSDIFCH